MAEARLLYYVAGDVLASHSPNYYTRVHICARSSPTPPHNNNHPENYAAERPRVSFFVVSNKNTFLSRRSTGLATALQHIPPKTKYAQYDTSHAHKHTNNTNIYTRNSWGGLLLSHGKTLLNIQSATKSTSRTPIKNGPNNNKQGGGCSQGQSVSVRALANINFSKNKP